MATSFDDLMGREPSDNRTAREKRETVVSEIIKDVEKESFALRLGQVKKSDTLKTRFRVQNSVPQPKWINGTTSAGDAPLGSTNDDPASRVSKDSGLKQTAKMDWSFLEFESEELAVLVPMPDAWRDDSDIAWSEIREALKTEFARAIDAAILWGESLTSHPLPSTFGNGVVPDTFLAGHIVTEDEGVDLADSYAAAMQAFEQRSFRATAGLVDLAETWRLTRLRSAGPEKLPIYTPPTSEGPGSIYGRRLLESDNGTFHPEIATAVFGDWSMLKIGVRQDITFKMFDQGVITDADGVVTYNAMEQDGEILRACMRIGYRVVDPFKHQTGQREWPFGLLAPVGYSS